MAFKGVLKIGGEERTLLTYHNYLFDMWYGDFVHVPEYFPTLYDYAAAAQASPYAFRRQAGTQPFGGLFDFTMESTDDDDFFYDWFKISERFGTRLEHGVIELYDAKDRYMPMRRIEFWDAWISEIAEYLRADSATPMTLHFTISPATIRVNKEVVFQKNWFVTDISQKSEQEEETHEPFVKRIFWKGREQGQERKDIMLNHDIKLQIELSDYRHGDTVELTVKQSNGRRIKSSSTEFSVSGTADENGLVIIENFKVECDFKDDNQNFGMIEFYHKDRRVGEFKENFGWTWVKDGHLIKIFTNLELQVNYLAMGCTEEDYKQAVNNQFKRTLELSSGGLVTGKLFFCGMHTQEPPQAVPMLAIELEKEVSKGEASTGTSTSTNLVRIESNKEDNGLLMLNLGESGVHELLHTLRLDHPFAMVQTEDTRLINLGWERLKTTPSTDPNIFYNIMNYNFKIIDDQYLDDLWKYKRPEYITKGQLQFIFDEIDKQKNGAGTINNKDFLITDGKFTIEVPESDYYWIYSIPGEPLDPTNKSFRILK